MSVRRADGENMEFTEKAKIAAEKINIPLAVAEKNHVDVASAHGTYFWNASRGGLHVFVGDEGETLAATSGVSMEQLIADYQSGRRN